MHVPIRPPVPAPGDGHRQRLHVLGAEQHLDRVAIRLDEPLERSIRLCGQEDRPPLTGTVADQAVLRLDAHRCRFAANRPRTKRQGAAARMDLRGHRRFHHGPRRPLDIRKRRGQPEERDPRRFRRKQDHCHEDNHRNPCRRRRAPGRSRIDDALVGLRHHGRGTAHHFLRQFPGDRISWCIRLRHVSACGQDAACVSVTTFHPERNLDERWRETDRRQHAHHEPCDAAAHQ
jgi:hypothetical protein